MQLFKGFEKLGTQTIVWENRQFSKFPSKLSKGVSYKFSNPTAWWMAENSIYDENGYVEKIIDISGNNYHFIQTTQANKPLFLGGVLNNHPVISFNGNNNFMQVLFGATFSQPNTIFIIYNINSGAPCVFDGVATDDYNNRHYIQYFSNQINMATGGGYFGYTKTIPFPYILNTCVYNTSNSRFYENGILKASGNAGSNSIYGLRIGSRWENTLWLIGDIAEIIFYDTLLREQQRQQVENYLMVKYNL